MRLAPVAIAGWVSGFVFGMVLMGVINANQQAKKAADLVNINGASIKIEDANKIGDDVQKSLAQALRKKGVDLMREAGLYENKQQWGGCSSYIQASALFAQATDWGDTPSSELAETAWNSGRRACDRWYDYERN